ncbi:DUF6634 family protein [Brucella anthropi]|uniref:DUF6634 family protein n=1 Tax=Brucella anthropi TaxID=529 RepID=UPI003985D547
MNSQNYLNDMISKLHQLIDDLKMLRDSKKPDHEILDDSPTLYDWNQTTRPAACLEGLVQEHPLLGRNRLIITSDLYYLDPEMRFARTLSRFYRLGNPARFRNQH